MMISYFTLATKLTAVFMVLVSYAMIFATILKSRKSFGKKQEEGEKQKRREQNMKIAKKAAIMTGVTLLPWLPNLIMVVLFELGLQEQMVESIGTSAFWKLVDATTYLFYVVPWMFPLLNILTNPVISKSLKSIRRR